MKQGAEGLPGLPSGAWMRQVPGRRCPRRGGTPQPTVPQDLLDHIALRRLDESDHFHHAAALGTGQRVDLGLREAQRNPSYVKLRIM